MNNEAQRIAIAEARGFRKCEGRAGWVNGGSHIYTVVGLPDYLNDLNAMHEAVDYMNRTQPDNWNDEHFLVILYGWTDGFPHRANAEQWAEAFLRTLNLWKE